MTESKYAKINNHYLYILRSSTNQLYIGITQDLEERVERHNKKDGAKFTKTGSDFVLVYQEEYSDLLSAMRREKQLKGWTRAKKEALIVGDLELLKKL